MITGISGARAGSSPLTRGKRAWRRTQRPPTRLIPAHAGKTRSMIWATIASAAHPRSRGENGGSAARPAPHGGSSPLTRGKLAHVAKMRHHCRLIPAHAGKTTTSSSTSTRTPAHPRSRGENAIQSAYKHSCAGSSPLTRGKRPPTNTPTMAGRLIPAHAGKTMWCAALPRRLQAHPRSRGENTS